MNVLRYIKWTMKVQLHKQIQKVVVLFKILQYIKVRETYMRTKEKIYVCQIIKNNRMVEHSHLVRRGRKVLRI